MNNIILNSPKDNTIIYSDNITIDYVVKNPDVNFYAIKFYVNDILVKTTTSFKGNFSILIENGVNNLKAYCINKNLKTLPDTEINVFFENVSSDIQKLNEINKLTQFQLPEFIKEDYSEFVDFIKEYYKFLEKSNDPNLIPYNLENYRDIDTVPEYILEKIKYELMQDFNLDITKDIQTGNVANNKNLLKNIKEFYNSKGTENALRFLFRILFDKEIEVYYPKTDVLRLSDGKWSEKTFLEIIVSNDEEAFSYINGTIYELNSLGVKISEAKIRSVYSEVKDINSAYSTVATFELDEINGLFNGNNLYVVVPINGVKTTFNVTKNTKYISKRYINDDGFVSSKNYIQDSNYYQDFSYDIKSDVSSEKFYEIVKKITHTAGTKLFSSALLTKSINSAFENIGVEVKYNGQVIIAHFMGYTPNTKQDLNNIDGDFDAYPDGYLFGEDGTSLYVPAGSTKTLTEQETIASNYSNITVISYSAVGDPVPVEDPRPGVLETTDESGTINNLVTHQYSNSIPVNFDLVNYIPADKVTSYPDYWIPGKHFKQFAKRDGILKDDDAELTIGEFTIEEIFNSQIDIENIVISQSDDTMLTINRKNTLNTECNNNCDKLYNTTKCFQTHLGQYGITDTEKPIESSDNYEFRLTRWKAYQTCMNPNRICKQNCEENYPTGSQIEGPVNVDE